MVGKDVVMTIGREVDNRGERWGGKVPRNPGSNPRPPVVNEAQVRVGRGGCAVQYELYI